MKKVVLCDDCKHCPEVIMSKTQVTIDENTNKVKLKPKEWNILVEKISNATLKKI